MLSTPLYYCVKELHLPIYTMMLRNAICPFILLCIVKECYLPLYTTMLANGIYSILLCNGIQYSRLPTFKWSALKSHLLQEIFRKSPFSVRFKNYLIIDTTILEELFIFFFKMQLYLSISTWLLHDFET